MVLEMQNSSVALPEDDMDSVASRALKGRITRCNQTRERSNGLFLINSVVCEYSHVLLGFIIPEPDGPIILKVQCYWEHMLGKEEQEVEDKENCGSLDRSRKMIKCWFGRVVKGLAFNI